MVAVSTVSCPPPITPAIPRRMSKRHFQRGEGLSFCESVGSPACIFIFFRSDGKRFFFTLHYGEDHKDHKTEEKQRAVKMTENRRCGRRDQQKQEQQRGNTETKREIPSERNAAYRKGGEQGGNAKYHQGVKNIGADNISEGDGVVSLN